VGHAPRLRNSPGLQARARTAGEGMRLHTKPCRVNNACRFSLSESDGAMFDLHRPNTEAIAAPRVGLKDLIRSVRKGRPTDRIRIAWHALERMPGGKKLFSKIIGIVAPYSGSIRAEVLELRKGYARAKMRDLPRLRNHLRCLHAIALSNLAEFTGNLALAYSIPGDARFIVTGMDMAYFHKARGEITAICDTVMPADNAEREVVISVDLKDADGILVSRGKIYSLIGPAKSRIEDTP
jgi:acyl-coenzyme A thioesterase PaaI-like protein